jgi:methionine synthase I (cobalamin-dependent)
VRGDLVSVLTERVLVADGAMGPLLQAASLCLDSVNFEDGDGPSRAEEFQLVPEQSTSAIILCHPEAKYFAAT